MKSTGIVRKVDELGRIVLPKELRQTLNINESFKRGSCGFLFIYKIRESFTTI